MIRLIEKSNDHIGNRAHGLPACGTVPQPTTVPRVPLSSDLFLIKYEGESVNMSQMNIKRETYDIRTWKKHLLLDISSANIDTLVPSLYQCVGNRSMEVF
jgi:hypothetical protein